MEYRLLVNDGAYRWVLHNGAPRYAADGAFLGYIGSRVDLTDQKSLEEHLRILSTQLVDAHEIERDRIGYELHEDLAQKLCALSIRLSRFSRECDRDRKLAAEFGELQRQLMHVFRGVVRLSHELRPATAEKLGLPAALRNLCHEATDHERAVVFMQCDEMPWLGDDLSRPLYRIAQEALENALAHSGATHIRIELCASATMVRLSVSDNGCGFVVGSDTKLGLGLSGMAERMRSSGGAFSISSNPGEGTVITATMPLTQSMKVAATSAGT